MNKGRKINYPATRKPRIYPANRVPGWKSRPFTWAGFDTDAAWLAGIIDGEGHVRIDGHKVLIEVTSTTKAIADRCLAICPSFSMVDRALPSGKTVYRCRLSSRERCQGLASIVVRFMHEDTKVERLRQILALDPRGDIASRIQPGEIRNPQLRSVS